MISYAQNYEDVMLHRVFREKTDGFYIDVGAADPVEYSVTKFFYDRGWSGINIEPNDWFYNRLMEQRSRDINLKLAIGERDECREFHTFERLGVSTFVDANRDFYVQHGHDSSETKVRVTTLAAICHDYVKREIDFLKVDCEGWEKVTLEGGDWERFRPIVVVVEATKPGTPEPSWDDWEPILTDKARYEMVYFDGLNRFYLRREYADLRCHFEVPPNVFDEFKPYTTELAEQQAKNLQQEQQSLLHQVAELQAELARVGRERVESATRLEEAESRTKRDQDEIEQLQTRIGSLKDELLKTRLWVGRLTQELAACKRC